MTIPAYFFKNTTIEMAKALLGASLIRKTSQGEITGRIVETEAYLATNDPACHAARGITERNKPMFGPPGRSYVYLIYGIYHCFNVVTAPKGIPEAVLIRALEPLHGITLMESNRRTSKTQNLCNGPGKLCEALQIDRRLNNHLLKNPPLRLHLPSKALFDKKDIVCTTRIGIKEGGELPLRFYVKDNPFVSKVSAYEF